MYLKALILSSIFTFTIFLCSFSGDSDQGDNLKQSLERGKELYRSYCITCHIQNGKGVPEIFPPLAHSDYLMDNAGRSIEQVINGVSGEITVNGVTYNNVMPGFDMTDQEVADVLNYIRNSWGNKGEVITEKQVSSFRK
ncbi:cytochrome c [Fulvivirga sp. 29W222]|uniref:Cytochrome c n=1 Tax=Fulvivirga marina TaxID=2494733 RepID=A0A937FYR4_9BACT|nr:cytochrome c [Fulvivirga marina]MBL6446946.1 cytochrome c [Fulvivirga marina]